MQPDKILLASKCHSILENPLSIHRNYVNDVLQQNVSKSIHTDFDQKPFICYKDGESRVPMFFWGGSIFIDSLK